MSTVAVVGLGDLGARILDALASVPVAERLVGVARDEERGRGLVGLARLTAAVRSGPRRVDFVRCDLRDIGGTAALLAALDADVVVTTASRYTWLRGVRGVPYATWLPLQLPTVRDLMRARAEAGSDARVVCLPFPDAVGPALAGLGLAPHVGAGNVGEVAPKLALLAGGDAEVRLVLHHAAQRHAFAAFAELGDAEAGSPPWAAELVVRGERLADERVEALFHAPWPLPAGAEIHDLTAAATVEVVEALLADELRRVHAPAPLGLPGGYPLRLSRTTVELDLPAGLERDAAVALNERAAAWDGIERIDADGTLVFTAALAEASERVLGLRLDRVAPADWDAAADELELARERVR